jgi:hypothetical protein
MIIRVEQDRRVKPLSNFLALVVLVFAGGAAVAVGCGSNTNSGSNDAGLVGTFDGSTFFGRGADGGDSGLMQGMLAIMPNMPIVTVSSGQPAQPVQFTATVGGMTTNVAWGIDRGELGTISQTGLFTPSGNIGGTATITAVYGGQRVSTTITVNLSIVQQGDPAWMAGPDGGVLVDAGTGGYGGVGGGGPGPAPSAAQMMALGGKPAADATVSILYPYDKTVWPQGLLAPLLQWDAGTHAFDSVYVHIQEKNYEYQGYFGANTTPFVNLPIPQAAWDGATLSNGGDALVITLVFGQGGMAFGPYTESWTIAQASLQGTIYYNSYGTSLIQNSIDLDIYKQPFGAATLAILPGATAPTLVAGVLPTGNDAGCRVCHTVSADGKSLVTQASTQPADAGAGGDYSRTVYLNLPMDTTAGAGTTVTTKNLAFPAYSKDGSLLFSSSGGMINGDTKSQLYDMPAGTPTAGVSGLPDAFKAALPAFSPDTKHVSFNFWGGTFPNGGATADQISLGVIDFDGKNAFSNPRVIYTPPSGMNGDPSVTYSSFLPTSTGVVFELELSNPTDKYWGYTWVLWKQYGPGAKGNTGELWWADLATGKAHRLDLLNGYGANGVYLPGNADGKATHTPAEDVTLNYEPTVNPIASGGYAWVVFTSRRMYGNVAQLGPWISDPRGYDWLAPDQITDKKLWVAAIDLNAPPGTDPSHPAFYLPAQELHAGNSRGYWSVEACKADGMACKNGTQCCGGYCQSDADGGLTCSSQMPLCAADYDKCMHDTDCCNGPSGVRCINNVCTKSTPPK